VRSVDYSKKALSGIAFPQKCTAAQSTPTYVEAQEEAVPSPRRDPTVDMPLVRPNAAKLHEAQTGAPACAYRTGSRGNRRRGSIARIAARMQRGEWRERVLMQGAS
jgi:hypothetical protein